jgi:hypothetical protein
MKIFLLLVITIFSLNSIFAQNNYTYVSPKPNSILVSNKTNIILRSPATVERSSLNSNLISVEGSKSGSHSGDLVLSDDNKTIIFNPSNFYEPNELVKVQISDEIKTIEGKNIDKFEFSFKISPLKESEIINLSNSANLNEEYYSDESVFRKNNSVVQADSLPTDLPVVSVGTFNNPSDGKIFLTNQSQTAQTTIGSYLLIYNNDGSISRYQNLPQSGSLFKVEPNGQLSYNLKGNQNRIILDTSFTAIDTLFCGNGYRTNGHDALLLPNGHALLFANDPEPVDMSQIIPGGNPNATVTGLVVQELDASKNVVFQWRSWDYLPITASYFDLTLQTIDLLHTNGLALDKDGNILVSIRHLSAIVKIKRETGDIDWILGGKLNQFTFIDEHETNAPTYFSYQHNIDVTYDGNITLFDNGTQHNPQYSRGVEYKLDEINKTATMVWEYRHSPDIYANAMGSVQKLPNGNHVIGWGNQTGLNIPVYTEVHPDNSVALELFFPPKQFCYRAYKYPWVSQIPVASVPVYEILQGNNYSFNNATDSTGIEITFDLLDSYTYSTVTVTKYNYAPLNPVFLGYPPVMSDYYVNIEGQEINSFRGTIKVNLNNFSKILLPQKTIIYFRPKFSQVFSTLPTSYDSVKKQFVFIASDFGDFAFGMPQIVTAYPPFPISPRDNEIVNGEGSVILQWGTRGIVKSYRLQIAADTTFNNLIADNSNLLSTLFTINSVNNNSVYYWRVNNTNSAGTSNWSNIQSFGTASPFIKVLSPKGGEKIYLDSTYVIRWESNINDTINIELMNKNTITSVIDDTIYSGTKAILWKVPSNLIPDSTYKVVISSISNSSLYALSDTTFTICIGITDVNSPNNIIRSYILNQNYPNPFNPSTTISWQLPVTSQVTIKVYDVLGREVSTLVDEIKQAGKYETEFNAIDLPSGVYFYRLQAGNYVSVKKLLLLK